MKVAIIGLGLIGGSLGLNFMKNKFISSVWGIDASAAHEELALQKNLVHEIIPFSRLAEADIICLCTPVSATVQLLGQLPPLAKSTTVVEFGSTKQAIAAAIPPQLRSQVILAHPMAGTEHSGPAAAFEGLFRGAVCVLADAPAAGVEHQHRIIELLSSLGMRLCFMDAAAHDHHSAIISHLPHVISFALANYVLGCEKAENIVHMAGGSFADMSRIAKSNPAMWGAIFEQNKANVSAALRGFCAELERFAAMLEATGDGEAGTAGGAGAASVGGEQMREWMQHANELKNIL